MLAVAGMLVLLAMLNFSTKTPSLKKRDWTPQALVKGARVAVALPREPVLLDGQPIQKPLPRYYPNGEANGFDCDLPALRYQCAMKEGVGCQAYPQLFRSEDIMRNWSPNDPDAPTATFSSICRFNISTPVSCSLMFAVVV